jgi:hypothetical protein
MLKRVMAATIAALVLSLKAEARRSIRRFTTRVFFCIVGIFLLLFMTMLMCLFTLIVVIAK